MPHTRRLQTHLEILPLIAKEVPTLIISRPINPINASTYRSKEEAVAWIALIMLVGLTRRRKRKIFRKGGILGAETVNGDVPESRAIYQASGSTWCDGEKSFPPKKRRSSFQRSRSSEDAMMEKDKKMKTKTKTKMISSNRCAQQINKEELGEEKETKARGLENSTGAKKLRARGGALMEGSRCSRVNGRGWRCCQQTLVGYSLCEHHLGKGRLRSMTSVRSRSLAASNTLTALKRDHESEPLSTTSSSLLENELKDSVLDNDCEDEDENKPLVFTKKRMKLGMVKARSIRSLLGQTNNGTVVADNQY
ncbi:hypothetical protein I3760_10G025700 [Carya illinoinensis]|nr:hypothetical protein I3760_10G025700 [Carya illinoinensis]